MINTDFKLGAEENSWKGKGSWKLSIQHKALQFQKTMALHSPFNCLIWELRKCEICEIQHINIYFSGNSEYLSQCTL